jgi:TP901 family phage tail tape measure protein
MPSIAAFVKLRAKDQTSKVFDKMARRAQRMERKTKRSFKGMSKAANGFKSVMAGVIGANVLTRGTQLLTQGIGAATREFVDFDQALTVASAKFPEKIKRGTMAFKELQDAARKVGAETQFTATESAQGLALFAAAGIDAKVSMAALEGVVDLATATSVEFEAATQAALDTMGQFGLKSKDAAKFTQNLERVNDSLVFTINSASIQMEDLTETLKFVGPIANTAGAEIEEVNSIIAAMAESGIRGSLAGTALKNMYLRLLEPTPKIRKELKKLKINLEDDNGEMRKMTDIIAQMEKGMGKMTKKQKATSLSILFGKRAVAGAAAAMDTGSQKIAKFEEQMRKAGGTSKDTADDIRKGLGNQLKILQSTAIELGFRLLEAFVGKGEKGIQKLTEAIRKFDVKPVVKTLKQVFDIISKTAQFLWDNRGLIKAIGVVVAGIEAAKLGMIAFNLVASANPIGAMVAGLVIAIGLIDTFYDKEKKRRLERKHQAFGKFIVKGDENIKDLNKQLAEAPKADLEKQLTIHDQLAKQLRNQSSLLAQVGEDTTEVGAAYREVKNRMQEIVNLQGRMAEFGPGTGNLFPGELPQLGPLDLGGVSAPNSSEVEARSFLSQNNVDLTVNNAQPGTTVNAKGSPAPRINTNFAGANP